MNRSALYAVIVIIVIIAVGIGIYAYQQSQRPSVEVKLDSHGLQVNGTGQ